MLDLDALPNCLDEYDIQSRIVNRLLKGLNTYLEIVLNEDLSKQARVYNIRIKGNDYTIITANRKVIEIYLNFDRYINILQYRLLDDETKATVDLLVDYVTDTVSYYRTYTNG